MAHANPYIPERSFSDDATSNVSGRSGVNATSLDNELLHVSESINLIINNQKLLQRDDGRLKDTSVEVHTLSRDVLMLLGNYRLRGGWHASTEYSTGDVAINDGLMYVCKNSHVSESTFIESPNWLQFGFAGSADAAQAAAQAINAANNAAASAISAQNAATTSTTKASEAGISANSASSSAVAAQTSANTASSSAAQAVSANNSAQAAAAHVDAINAALSAPLAPLESPALTGMPTAPIAAIGTNTAQIATTAFVNAEIAADRPFESTLANIKMDGEQSVGSLNTVARGDHVHPTDTSRAPLESPALTGTPTAPTAALGTNTNQLATTAFVNAKIAADVANAVRSKIMITSNTIWTSPVTGTVYVSGCGGGGGGAGAYAAQQLSGGGGGGAGRSVMRQSITVAADASYAVSIGSGGLAGGAGLVGGVGGNTTIGTLLTLEGGGGGAVGTGYNGGGGGSGYPGGDSGNGAYGGGEVGTGGMGASTIFGGGGGGGTSAKAVGQNAYGYGAGGGGGAGNSTAAGGAGAPGLIIIEFN